MRFNSATFKLLVIIASAFAVTTIGVVVLADIHLKRILDRSQETVYSERLDTIVSYLRRSHERLKKTGLVEAYTHDFQQSTLAYLRNSYYRESSASIYPFILHTDGTVVMHPELEPGDGSLKSSCVARHIGAANDGHFVCVYRGQTKWYRFRRFDAWAWTLVYAVPIDIKYRDAQLFRNALMGIMGGVTLSVLTVLALVVRRFTRPIVRLTEASRQIADGNLDTPIDLSGDDEVGILARAFEHMRDAVNKQVAALNQEIKERRQAEKSLQESETRLSEAQKLAGLGYWDWDLRTGAVEWSEEVYGIFRLNPSEFKPQIDSIMALSPWPEHNQRHRNLIEALSPGQNTGRFDQKFLRPDGSIGYYHSTFRGSHDPEGNLISVSGIVLDITERKMREAELQRLRHFLSNIIDSMPSMLVAVDADGIVTQWNLEAVKKTGRSTAAALGKPLDHVVPRLAAEKERIRRAIQDRRKQYVPKCRRQENGNSVYEDLTVYPLVANGVEGAVIRIDDVTEKVRMEEMMIQSEKMLSIGGLAAGMAHEINNPLAGMIQTARVMSNRLAKDSTIPANLRAAEAAGTTMAVIGDFMEARGIHRMIDTIIESGKRVADIVANMLSFARKSDARVSSHSLTELMDKSLELAATDYDMKKHHDFKLIEIVKEYAPNLPPVPCEGAKIQQVLLNLLRNGAQALQDKQDRTPRFIIRAYADEPRSMVCLEIEDNGPGMDDATRKRVFEPFFTTKPVDMGTGLGLSVSYFIITENHKGQMQVASTPGRGTTFTIRLPLEGPA